MVDHPYSTLFGTLNIVSFTKPNPTCCVQLTISSCPGLFAWLNRYRSRSSYRLFFWWFSHQLRFTSRPPGRSQRFMFFMAILKLFSVKIPRNPTLSTQSVLEKIEFNCNSGVKISPQTSSTLIPAFVTNLFPFNSSGSFERFMNSKF